MAAGFSAPRSALPLPELDRVRHRFIQLGSTRFHFAEAGDGPPLLLLHGWPQHWWEWRHLIPPLAERYRVICPDIRGLGWSDGASGSYSWDSLAGDLFALLSALKLERVRLVGHDWGLLIGYRACLLWPERFERFVALSLLHPWQPWDFFRMALPRYGAWHVPMVATFGGRALRQLELAERGLRGWRHNGKFSQDEAAVYLGPLRRPQSIEASARFFRTLSFSEVPRLLRESRKWKLQVPTLHLNGAYDPVAPPPRPDLPLRIPAMRADLIPNCGHFIPEEAPDSLLERLEAFL